MDFTPTFGKVWRGSEGDLRRLLKDRPADTSPFTNPEWTIRRVRIQARMADELREALDPLVDYVSREVWVTRSTKDLGRALMSGGDLTAARKSWASNAVRATMVSDSMEMQLHREDMQRQLLASGHTRWIWRSHLDRRTCAYCIAMHGTRHSIYEPMVSHIGCRCVPVAVGEVDVTGTSWLGRQNRAFQDRLLTPLGARAWRGSRVSLAALLDTRRFRRLPLYAIRMMLGVRR